MNRYTEIDMERAFEAGYLCGVASGENRQWIKDKQRFEAETAALRQQLNTILEHIATLEALKPKIIFTETT